MASFFKLAVVGSGGIARHHMKNILKMGTAHIVGLCDLDQARAEACAREFGGKVFAGLSDMLDSQRPDGLLICTPPFARIDPIKAACDRKLPFFCEKPPAFSLEEAVAIQRLVGEARMVHSVGFMYRHKEIVDRARELLEGQTPVSVRSTFVNGPMLDPEFPAWFKLQERSGGPLLDQAIHFIDVLRYIFGDIDRVFAAGSNQAFPKAPDITVNDSVNLLLQFRSGLSATHNHSWAANVPLLVIEVHCKSARIRIDLKENVLSGVVRGMQVSFKPKDDCYVTELRRFFRAASNNDPVPVRSSYADAVRSLAVCVAAQRSIDTGLPEIVTTT